MQLSASHDRRRFLRLALGLSTGAMLAGCGGSGPSGDTVAVVPANAATLVNTPAGPEPHPLNLALNLAYLGAQYHTIAVRGEGLGAALTGGVGRAGAAIGARQASFADPVVAARAAELADDKQAHVAALRDEIGTLAAAQPQLDFSTGATGAFARAAQGAKIVAPGSGFDPYAGDTNFLLGALLVENVVAATYRTLLAQGPDASAALVQTHLADAVYHGGLIRALLDDRAAADPAVGQAVAGIAAMLAAVDGTDQGDQTLAGANGASSDIVDAAGRAIPFTRAGSQVLKALYLSSSAVGGFLPAGANGVVV